MASMEDSQRRRTEELIRAHYEELDRVGYIDRPVDVARNAIDHLVFAMYVSEAVRSGSINPGTFKQVLRVHTGGPGLTVEKTHTQEHVRAAGWNLLLGALAISAQAMDRALDEAFGSRPLDRRPAPRPDELSDLEAARVIVYMIRCAFAHDPFNPRWVCRGPYQGVFRVAVVSVELDARPLNGERLKPEHHGGVEGYIQLLVFCLGQLEAQAGGSELRPKSG
jgi:hypothetical protein